MKKKVIAVIACMTMICTLIPGAVFAAGESSMQIGSAGINNQDSVYYGKYTDKYPTLEWKVLDADKTNTNVDGMFLITKDALGTGKYGNVYFDNTRDPKSTAYQNSDAQGWCTGFYNGLAVPERSAIMETTKSDLAFTSIEENIVFDASSEILKNDKVFFLSAQEAENSEYGFTNDAARIAIYKKDDETEAAAGWRLRSPVFDSDDDSSDDDSAGFVRDSGAMGYSRVTNDWTARPAFNLNLNSVIFSSAVEGGKNGDEVGEGSLQPQTAEAKPTAWKLTLKDSDRNTFKAEMTELKNNTATISYENASVGTDEYISAIVTDKDISNPDCNIKYYGRITQPASANGTATINLAGKYSDSDKLYIFSEQYNGNEKTDYASPLRELPIQATADTPTTGDNSNITLWAMLALIAALAAAGTIIAKKRKQEN